jgi:hypothetical protein
MGGPSGSIPKASLVAGVQFGLHLVKPVAAMIFLINPLWVSLIFPSDNDSYGMPRNSAKVDSLVSSKTHRL